MPRTSKIGKPLAVDGVVLPAVFRPDGDGHPVLAALHKELAKGFSWTRVAPVEAGADLAYWLHLLGRDDDALSACAFLAGYEFAGDHRIWSPVAAALALQARLLRGRGLELDAEAAVARIRAAGFVARRLKGALLRGYRRNAELRRAEGDRAAERGWLMLLFRELITISSLGGSSELPVATVEAEATRVAQALRQLA